MMLAWILQSIKVNECSSKTYVNPANLVKSHPYINQWTFHMLQAYSKGDAFFPRDLCESCKVL